MWRPSPEQKLSSLPELSNRQIPKKVGQHCPTQPISNLPVRKWTNQHRVTITILNKRLKLFGHICELTYRTITPGHFKPLSTVYQRIGNTRAIIPDSHGCGWSTVTSRLRTSASPQPGISHTDVAAGIVLSSTAILWEEWVNWQWWWVEAWHSRQRYTSYFIVTSLFITLCLLLIHQQAIAEQHDDRWLAGAMRRLSVGCGCGLASLTRKKPGIKHKDAKSYCNILPSPSSSPSWTNFNLS